MRGHKGRFIIVLLVLCLVITGPASALAANAGEDGPEITAEAGGPETTAEAAVIIEPISGQIVYEKEPYKELPMASVTKIMTMLLAVEALEAGKVKLEDMVTTSEHASSMGGSQIYLAPQEELSFQEMLISIATGSANDASVAVGEHLAGSEEAFVQLMNERAAELGMKHTHYVNPTGLPAEGHYSCAYDLALALRQAMKYQTFREVTKIKEYDLRGGEFKLWNTNKLLWWYNGADAGKTGWTNEAKYCLASSAKKDNLRLITVVLGVPETKGHIRESMKLYNWGFARYEAVVLGQEGDLIKTVPVEKGVDTKVNLILDREATVVVPKGEKEAVETSQKVPDSLLAPLAEGEAVGSYVVTFNGKEVARIDITAEKAVPAASFLDQLRRVSEKITG